MGRLHKHNAGRFAHCPHCSKRVALTKKGNYAPHLRGGLKCIAGGARPQPQYLDRPLFKRRG